jgi:chemotaxis protein MotB
VRGYADQMLRVKDNPYDPSNRRISILVKNDKNGEAPKISAPGTAQSPAGPAPQSAAAGAEKPSQTATPTPAKPSPANAARTGMFDKLKGMLPGGKK